MSRACLWAVASKALLCLGVPGAQARDLTFEERLKAQEAIERVYWAHRIWPNENPQPKPAFVAMVPQSAVRAKVTKYLAKSNALARRHRPITGRQLQAELDRMSRETRDRTMLRELLGALGNDPFLIAETLGRQTLVERLISDLDVSDECDRGSGRVEEAGPYNASSVAECMISSEVLEPEDRSFWT